MYTFNSITVAVRSGWYNKWNILGTAMGYELENMSALSYQPGGVLCLIWHSLVLGVNVHLNGHKNEINEIGEMKNKD